MHFRINLRDDMLCLCCYITVFKMVLIEILNIFFFIEIFFQRKILINFPLKVFFKDFLFIDGKKNCKIEVLKKKHMLQILYHVFKKC